MLLFHFIWETVSTVCRKDCVLLCSSTMPCLIKVQIHQSIYVCTTCNNIIIHNAEKTSITNWKIGFVFSYTSDISCFAVVPRNVATFSDNMVMFKKRKREDICWVIWSKSFIAVVIYVFPCIRHGLILLLQCLRQIITKTKQSCVTSLTQYMFSFMQSVFP